ncbi:MAG: fibronectin type III domain-containing protein [Actinomycetales bacterium]|nr:fibronectin type III domain-containing protein [Actinomycetales bacterium]
MAGDNSVTVSWKPVDAASPNAAQPTSYRVTVLPGSATHDVAAPATSLRIDDLRNGVRYGFTVTAINQAGASAPSTVVEATPSSAVEGEVTQMIVAYEPGAKFTEAPGVATGSSAVTEVDLAPGSAIGTGMRTVVLSEAVTQTTAEKIADQLTADPRVKWAEPDYFVPMLDDQSGPLGLPAKSGPAQPSTAAAQATKATMPTAAQVNSPEVGAQTACTASASEEPIARCFDDSDYDAGASLDGEIIWSDAYVTSGNRSTLLIDTVPYRPISDRDWLLYYDTYLAACIDSNGDSVNDACIIPTWASLDPNQSTGVTIYDIANGVWTARSSTCSGLTTRKVGDHAAIGGTSNAWWQFSIDWSCLVGSAKTNVRVKSYLRDYLYPAGDYSPNAYTGTPINFATMADSTVPGAPTGVGLTAVGGGLAATWSAPGVDGGAPITSYTARAYAAASGGAPLATCTTASLTCTISGLAPGTAAWVDVSATNAVGQGAASSPRTSGIPAAAVVPSSPTALAVSPTSGTLRPRWSAPVSDGGSAVTGYVARAYSQESAGTAVASCTTSGLQCAISGLVNGQVYWIDVAATNAVGSGAPTSPRVSATPAVGLTPNDPYYANNSMWGLNGTYGINAPDAWAVTRGSPSTIVAVLDTGITVHPDLAGTSVAGYDMIVDPTVSVDGNGRDSDPSDPGDASGGYGSSWHGTHVAGTINAIASNGIGVVGIAPDVKVQNVRVLGAGGGYTSDILAGITWASGGSVPGVPANPTPAKVINMSLGGYGSCGADWQAAINSAVGRGTTIVVAAGNSNASASNFTPASCANVVTVAAIGSNGKRASFSNYGSMVEVAAPGVGIWSTLNTGTTSVGSPTYASYSGTSMATPHVVGVVALMLSQDPSLTPAQVSTRLTTPSLLTAFPGGACDSNPALTCGQGIVNAGPLVGAASAPAASVPGAPTGVAGTAGVGQVTVSWTAPASDGGSAITGYTARAYSALTGGTALGTCTTSALSCTISGLSAGVTAYLEVVATNAVGSSPASSPRASAATAAVPGAPTAVAAAAAAGAADVSWTAPASDGGSAITGYTARAYTAASGGSLVGSCTTSGTACSITGLVNGTTSYVAVVATNGIGTGPASAPRVAVTPRTVPSAPRLVAATIADSRVLVTWAAPASTGGSAITGYTATAFTDASAGTSAGSCQATALRCTITGLVNGTTYYVEVAATNAIGTGAASSPRVASTPRTTPGASSGVLVTPGAGQLSVSWTAPVSTGGSAITGYVARAVRAATGGSPARTCVSVTTACTITGLVNGTTYYVEVVASNLAGLGVPTSPRVSETPRTVPTAPLRVVSTPGDRQLTIAWTVPASTGGSPVTGYTASAFAAASGGAALATCTTATTTCQITDLPNGTPVYVEVTATNAAGDSLPSSPRVASTPRTRPDAPGGVAVTSGAAQLTVTWAAPASTGGSSITGYTASAFSDLTGGAAVKSCSTTGALTCVLSGLANGSTYYVEVIARNIAGAGPASSPRESGVPMTAPAVVRSVSVSAQDGGVQVNWTAPASNGGAAITGYTARAWSRASGGALVGSCTSTTTSCVIEGLANGTIAYVDVVAINRAGTSASIARASATPRTRPAAVRSVSVTPGTRSLTVRWAAPASTGGAAITSYTVRAYASAEAKDQLGTCQTAGTSCTISGLGGGVPVFVDVVATNAAGPGASQSSLVSASAR